MVSVAFLADLDIEEWVCSSLVERLPDKKEAHGSIPCTPTKVARRAEVDGPIPS